MESPAPPRVPAPPRRGAPDAGTILALQRTAGNAAVAAMVAHAAARRETPAGSTGGGIAHDAPAKAAGGVLQRKRAGSPAHAPARAHAAHAAAPPAARAGAAKTGRARSARVKRAAKHRVRKAFRNLSELIAALIRRPTTREMRLACQFLDARPIEDVLSVGRALARRAKAGTVQKLEAVARRMSGVFKARLAVALAAARLEGEISRIDFQALYRKNLATLRRRARKDVEDVLEVLGPKPRELRRMRACRGFIGLEPWEKRRLTYIVGGSTSITTAAAPAMRTLLGSGAPVAEPTTFRTFITAGQFRPKLIGLAYKQRLPQDRFKLISDEYLASFAFDTGTVPARRRVAQITGKTAAGTLGTVQIPITGPVARPPFLASHIEMANGLARVPLELSRSKVQSVELNPVKDPRYPSAYMYVNPQRAGVVSVFPRDFGYDVNEIARALMHETGHFASIDRWGQFPSEPPWNEWRSAMSSDALVVSQYATTSEHEDFAESWELWAPNRNGPRMNELRAIIPNRIDVMEKIASGVPPATEP